MGGIGKTGHTGRSRIRERREGKEGLGRKSSDGVRGHGNRCEASSLWKGYSENYFEDIYRRAGLSLIYIESEYPSINTKV